MMNAGQRSSETNVLRAEQQERELALSEQRFRALIENSSDGIALTGLDGTIHYASPSTTRILGYTPEELVGRNGAELMHPDDVGRMLELYGRLIEKPGDSAIAQWRDRHKDGSWRWLEGVGTNLLAEPGVQALVTTYRDITDRKRAEESLRKSEVRSRELLESAPDAIVIVDGGGHIVMVNHQTERMFGYQRAELLGQPVETLLPERLRPAHVGHRTAYVSQPRARPMGVGLELSARRKDGSEFPIDVSLSPLQDDGGFLVTSVIRDVTGRKQIEQALEASEKRFRALIENSSDAISLIGADGMVRYESPAAARMLHYTSDELVGASAFERIHPDDQPYATDLFRQLLARPGASVTAQLRLRRKDGSWRWVEATGTNLLAEQSVQAVVANYRDITEHKQAEAEVRLLYTIALAIGEAENLDSALATLLRRVCEVTGWVVGEAWTPSSDGIHLVYSPAWYSAVEGLERFRKASETFTFPPGIGLPGRVWSSKRAAWIEDVSLDSNFSRAPFAVEAGLKAGLAIPVLARDEVVAVIEFFVFERREEDERLIDLVSAVAAELGAVILRKRAEAEVRRLNDELEQRVRQRTAELEAANNELEAFSYSVSHDLRAPLRHIAGYTALLQAATSAALDEKSRRYLATVADSAKRMGNLIDDLLAFSRTGRAGMQPAPVNLEQLIQEALHDLRHEAGGRNVVWKIGPLPEVYGDRSMLRLVWINLISNALKFTRIRPQAEIEIGCAPGKDNETVCFIRDNGVGFDMKYVDKLFGVFQRLHRAEEFDGTGIGLANVRRIISRHGGRTWAEGSADGGAVFYFSVPKSPGE